MSRRPAPKAKSSSSKPRLRSRAPSVPSRTSSRLRNKDPTALPSNLSDIEEAEEEDIESEEIDPDPDSPLKRKTYDKQISKKESKKPRINRDSDDTDVEKGGHPETANDGEPSTSVPTNSSGPQQGSEWAPAADETLPGSSTIVQSAPKQPVLSTVGRLEHPPIAARETLAEASTSVQPTSQQQSGRSKAPKDHHPAPTAGASVPGATEMANSLDTFNRWLTCRNEAQTALRTADNAFMQFVTDKMDNVHNKMTIRLEGLKEDLILMSNAAEKNHRLLVDVVERTTGRSTDRSLRRGAKNGGDGDDSADDTNEDGSSAPGRRAGRPRAPKLSASQQSARPGTRASTGNASSGVGRAKQAQGK